jgi:hypothetical protein
MPQSAGYPPLVTFALTHKMYGSTIAEPQHLVFGSREDRAVQQW